MMLLIATRLNLERHAAYGFFLSYIDISYCAVVLMSFQALACREESDGEKWLIVAPDVRCDTGIHSFITPLAYVGICGIGICYPLYMGCYVMLYRIEEDSKHVTKVPSVDMINATGFFFDSFHSRANLFSCVILARNFLFCAVFTLEDGAEESITIMPLHWRTPGDEGCSGCCHFARLFEFTNRTASICEYCHEHRRSAVAWIHRLRCHSNLPHQPLHDCTTAVVGGPVHELPSPAVPGRS